MPIPVLSTCDRLDNGSPKMSTFLFPEPVNVTLYSKIESVDVIKLMASRWVDYPRGSDVITKFLIK